MKPVRVYQCEDTQDGIFTAVYDAGKSRYGHDHIRIQAQTPGLQENYDLFSEYITVMTDPEKAEKVCRSVRQQISEDAYKSIMRAVRCDAEDKADVIYHFIVYGFALGAKVTDALQIPWVQRIFELNRKFLNEAHYFKEFLRFQEIKLERPVLFAVFEPQNQVLHEVTTHFADRLNPEWFIIYDKAHREASFHDPEAGWYVRKLEQVECERLEELEEQREDYVDLWKAFFETIRIVERENPNLQRSNLPLRYRKHMPEFH